MDEHNEEYRILGLNNDATKDEIQLAYKKYFLKYQHLENKTKEDEEKFAEIEKAYNTLMDLLRKKARF